MKEINALLRDYPEIKEWWKQCSDEEVMRLACHPDPDREFHELALSNQLPIWRYWRDREKS